MSGLQLAAQRVLDVYAGKDAEPYQPKLHEAMQTLNDALEAQRLSAPDLLAALAGLTEAISFPMTTKVRVAFDLATSAIAQAKGEA